MATQEQGQQQEQEQARSLEEIHGAITSLLIEVEGRLPIPSAAYRALSLARVSVDTAFRLAGREDGQ